MKISKDGRVDYSDTETRYIERGYLRPKPMQTSRMKAVERRILDGEDMRWIKVDWWELLELFLVRVSICAVGLVLLTVAELYGPVEYLSCYPMADDPGVLGCEYGLDWRD